MTKKPLISLSVSCLLSLVIQNATADPSENWGGCYAGASAGYGEADIEGRALFGIAPPPGGPLNDDIGSADAKGGTIGAQLGCDYQTGNWVIGPQASLHLADMDGSHVYITGSSPSDRMNYDINQFATLTGRIGYLMRPDTLPYIKAGAAWTRTNHRDADPTVPYSGSEKITQTGWLLGVGVEHRLQQNWSIFAEYSYMDFGKEKATIHYNDGFIVEHEFEQEMQTLGLGINYRF